MLMTFVIYSLKLREPYAGKNPMIATCPNIVRALMPSVRLTAFSAVESCVMGRPVIVSTELALDGMINVKKPGDLKVNKLLRNVWSTTAHIQTSVSADWCNVKQAPVIHFHQSCKAIRSPLSTLPSILANIFSVKRSSHLQH